MFSRLAELRGAACESRPLLRGVEFTGKRGADSTEIRRPTRAQPRWFLAWNEVDLKGFTSKMIVATLFSYCSIDRLISDSE
jgi:hypothetical protein